MSDELHLTPRELCTRLKDQVTVGTLKQWRYQRKGPPYVKVGGAILYPLSSVIEWEQKNTVRPEESRQDD